MYLTKTTNTQQSRFQPGHVCKPVAFMCVCMTYLCMAEICIYNTFVKTMLEVRNGAQKPVGDIQKAPKTPFKKCT